MGALLLDLKNPLKIINGTNYPILEPEMKYEKEGQVPNVVFPCGAIILKGRLFIYYGGADKVIGLAVVKLNKPLRLLNPYITKS